ncbi:preprotein translocase subunit SecE [Candidatus Dependentiae bacterium]|nr:preprotein translocase subunit SecE [Candidatus Dependentiae bacterium]
MNKLVSFLVEVRTELTKVSWPSREELVGSTVIVCILVAVFAVILSGMDAGFSAFIKSLGQ